MTGSFIEHFISGLVSEYATQLGLCIIVSAPGTAPAEDWLDVADVRLQEGFSPAPVRHRHIATERLMAQRYFRTWSILEGDSPTAGTSPSQSVAIAVSAAAVRHFVDLPSQRRRAPDIAFHRGAHAGGSDTSWNIRLDGAWVNAATTTLEVRTESQLIFEIAATVTEGLSYRTNGAWTAEAEL